MAGYPQTVKPAALKVTKIKHDFYFIEGQGGNSEVFITDAGVLLVDDKFERTHDELISKIKSVSEKPVKLITK